MAPSSVLKSVFNRALTALLLAAASGLAARHAIVVDAGDGGNGITAGGVGGALSGLTFNAPTGRLDNTGVQTTLGEPIVLFAGNGGTASGAASKGGAGGDVNGIALTKDITSVRQ